MSLFLFAGGLFLDPRRDEVVDGIEILVEGERVKEVSDRPIKSQSAVRIDLRGRTLMPGLIDAHLHVFLNEVNISQLDAVPLTLLAINGSIALKQSLMRGFTSVRDTAGGDFGIKAAVEKGSNWGTYVAAHAYSAKAIMRAVSSGVRTIEHGNLIDEPTAALMARKGAFLVPTLVTYDSMRRRGRDYGLTEYSLQKNEVVLEAGLRSLDLARKAGVKIGFGTDLLGQLQNDQCLEFTI